MGTGHVTRDEAKVSEWEFGDTIWGGALYETRGHCLQTNFENCRLKFVKFGAFKQDANNI